MQRLQSLLSAELRAAQKRLSGRSRITPTAIHRTRQHVKRARSVLRLLRSALGTPAFRRVDRSLRDVNRMLRDARDSTVVLQTLSELGRRRAYLQPAAAAVQAHWRRHRSDYRGLPLVVPDLSLARSGLSGALAAAQRWELGALAWRYALQDLRRNYRKGRKRYRQALQLGSDAAWHACRQQTKYLYYQLQLAPFAPLGLKGLVDAARGLEETLGAERDLMLLAAALRRTGTLRSAAGRGLLPVIEARRKRLLHKASTRGDRLYHSKAGEFERRIKAALRAEV